MRTLLAAAGRAFLRAFGGSLVVLGPGILAAPNLHAMRLLGVAAFIASIAAGIRALQAYAPALSVGHYLGRQIGVYVDAFLRAFVGALVVTLPGALDAPDLSTGKSLATAALIGAFTAALRAVQGFLTPGESPVPSTGVKEPPLAHEA